MVSENNIYSLSSSKCCPFFYATLVKLSNDLPFSKRKWCRKGKCYSYFKYTSFFRTLRFKEVFYY
jgi:peroxiredoxin